MLTGGGIVIFAVWVAVSPKEMWQEWVVVFFGEWLLIVPGTLDYDIAVLTWNNVAVGLIAAIFAIWRIIKSDIEESWTGHCDSRCMRGTRLSGASGGTS